MRIRAVLFDFAGTLLVPSPARAWATSVLGERMDDDLIAELVSAGRAGGPEPAQIPDGLAEDYARRDTSAELHRAVYEALLRPVVGAVDARALYDASCAAAGWEPYPDARSTLEALRGNAIQVVVVSNVGFDLRTLFAEHGMAELIDYFVLSDELGVMKPAEAIFRAALDAAGVEPAEALMVGDNPRADGGAVDLGIPTLLLPYSPPGTDHGLAAVLALVGVSSTTAPR